MSKFTQALIVTPLDDGQNWVVLGEFGYDVGEEDSGDTIMVERGFVTDFASIPRLLWVIFPKWGKYGNAAVIHDWLYWVQTRSRKESDAIMLEAMGILRVSKITRHLIYRAVRVFGWWAWYRNGWDREKGVERVLQEHAGIKFSYQINRPGIVLSTLKKAYSILQ
jgi:hypothetical protein